MSNIVRKVQSNRVFRLFSSVKLAVPLMLVLGTVVAVGTFYESRYNAEYARLMVYGTVWFEALLVILGLNIFISTLSRWPWQKRHIGFLITHLGMITLLIGSAVTKYSGVDGQMYVIEGETSNKVALDERVLEITGDEVSKKVFLAREAKARDADYFSSANRTLATDLQVVRYEPFVEADPALMYAPSSPGTVLRFRIKSAFFDQTVSLHSVEQSEIQMGPARFRLVMGDDAGLSETETAPKISPHTNAKTSRANIGAAILLVKNKSTQAVLKEIAIADLAKKPAVIDGVKISLKKRFSHATVAQNKITEGSGRVNPAIEIELEKGAEKVRELLFARFPGFSLAAESSLGLQFTYLAGGSDVAATEPAEGDMTSAAVGGDAPHAGSGGNVMEFHVSENLVGEVDPQVQLKLFKNGASVKSELLALNTPVTTPWMNIEVTLLGVEASGGHDNVIDMPPKILTEPTAKADRLPISAVQVRLTENGETFWLVEGQVRSLELGEQEVEVYYGRHIASLPFQLTLNKFSKHDYPGTETAMSFESQVLVSGEKKPVVISMNEPLKKEGYTLYQASYDMTEGRPVASVFSVNKDPGRPVKYAGSLILALGIILYTLSKSRMGRASAATPARGIAL